MDIIKLEMPTLERKEDALEYIKELREEKSKFNGCDELDTANSYEEWLERITNWSKGLNLPKGFSPACTYFAVRENDNKIIGMTNIRYIPLETIEKNGGSHIGYSVRPSERKKGYATEILKLGILKIKEYGIKEIHVGCYSDNIGSKRVIEKNGGIAYKKSSNDNGKITIKHIISVN